MSIFLKASILLTSGLLSLGPIRAQMRETLPTIEADDTVRIYAAQSLEALGSNWLKDVPCLVLQGKDRMLLSEILGHNYLWHQRAFTSFSEGLFVEVRPLRGAPFSYYMTSKGYTPIANGAVSITYSYTRKRKAAAKELIKKYQLELPNTFRIFRYDHLPMKSILRQPTACLLCPGSWNWLDVCFLVQMDSSQVKPVMYNILKKRKKGSLIVSRYIPLLFYYDKSVFAKETASDSVAENMINKLIPGWNHMSDPERMRLLDDCINH